MNPPCTARRGTAGRERKGGWRRKRWALAALFLAVLAAESAHPASKLPREINGADGARMVLVPGGEFIMGSPLGSYIFGDNEAPQRRVYLKTFYIDKYEVTNALFRKSSSPSRSTPARSETPISPSSA